MPVASLCGQLEALSSLVRGASSVESSNITGLTWSHIVAFGCMPWINRVDSASSPTDGFSRERLQGPWTLEPNPASERPVGRAPGGPCFKPSGSYPRRRAIGRLTPQSGLLPLPTGEQGPKLGSLRGRRTLACDQSSKVKVLPLHVGKPTATCSGRGSLPFPRLPARTSRSF